MILFTENKAPTIKIYINESQENTLTEALSPIVYHFTSLMAAREIVQNNVIYLQSPLGVEGDNMRTKQQFFLSTTRQKSSQFGYSQKFSRNGVRITLDGDLLNQRFKSKPVAYWNSDDIGKRQYYNNNDTDFQTKQHHTNNESEDRLFSYQSKIENARQYIKRIDVVIDKENHDSYITAQNILLSYFGYLTYVYDNTKDFDAQSDNTLNQQMIEDYDNSHLQVKRSGGDKANTDTIKKVAFLILIGEVDDNKINQEMANLLRKNGLEKYINGNLFRDLYYYNIEELVSDVKDKLRNYSRSPSEDRSKVLQMLADYFKEHGFKTYQDVINYKFDLGTVSSRRKIDDVYDHTKTISMFVWIKNSWEKYLLGTTLDNVPFKRILETNENMEYFLDDLEYYARDYYTSKDDYQFKLYIKSLINKGISIKDMYSIFRKLNLSNEDIENLIHSTIKIEQITLFDYYNYRFLDEPKDMSIYKNLKHERRFMAMFKKNSN